MKSRPSSKQTLESASAVVRDLFGPSVGAILESRTAYLERARKPSADTARHKARPLSAFWGHRGVREVSDELCIRYAEKRRADGVADATIWGELSQLHAALSRAHRNGLIPALPTFWKPAPPRRRERWLSVDEATRLIAAADRARHVQLFIGLALATGAREAALLELTWNRVDFEHDLIILDNPARPLTSKRRATVRMNATARAALEEARGRARSKYVIEWGGRKVNCVWSGVQAAARRAGLKNVSPHTLRRTCASWMAQRNVPLLAIAEHMGISLATAADSYMRLAPGHLAAAAAAVELEKGNAQSA